MVTPSIRWVDETASTNSLLAAECATLGHGAVIAARRQTAGRGQRGNSWESAPGVNLTFSLLLRPEVIEAASQFELSMIVALGVCDGLASASGLEFCVKWPNDIYVGDRKVCGILIENSLEGRRIGRSIAGIGINVNQREFVSDAPNPASLLQLTGRQYALEPLLHDVCSAILSRLDTYEAKPDAQTLVNEYRSSMWRRDGFYLWRDAASGEVFEAEIADVSATGMLTLHDRQRRPHVYAFKEVAAVL